MDIKATVTDMRKDIVRMTYNAGFRGAHLGGSLSCVEILAVLYCELMRYDTANPLWEYRDRFILSKAHGAMCLYTALKQVGFLTQMDIDEALSDGSFLCEHPCMNRKMGIEMSGGSLGQGLSFGVGTAIALKKRHINTSKVYVLVGDGECNEGQIWEAAATASHYCLDNLVVIVDENGLQFDGTTKKVQSGYKLEDRWRGIGFSTHIVNGHDIDALHNVLKAVDIKPKAVIAKTVKGKGVTFAENNVEWHSKFLTKESYEKALGELE